MVGPRVRFDPKTADLGAYYLPHAERVIVFVDVVESVRLIQSDQDLFLRRWLEVVAFVRNDLLPSTSGRLVKSLGDGMLLEFTELKDAVSVAFQMRNLTEQKNARFAASQQMHLRLSISLGEVIQDEDDIYGHDVNVGARLMSLAGAGEIVISSAVRSCLTADIDADIEDLGDCYLRHLSEPIRAFLIRPPGGKPVWAMGMPSERMKPTIAILPFESRSNERHLQYVGEALADEVIQAVSRGILLDVISRLSSRSIGGRGLSSQEISSALGADYILSGSLAEVPDLLVLDLELCDAHKGSIIWTDRHCIAPAETPLSREAWLNELAAKIMAQIVAEQLRSVGSRPLASLQAHTVLTAAVNLMHRLKRRDFDRARELLDVLLDRAPHEPLILARTAEWHLMRLQQGWVDDQKRESFLASDSASRALDRDPNCSIALMVDGAVQAHFFKRVDLAEARYDEAIDANNSNGMAWLRRGALCAFTDRGDRAKEETSQALKLSPLDPSRFLYEAIAASACLVAGDDVQALALAKQSFKRNRLHTSTLRVMAVAQWRLGETEAARESARELLRLEPDFTIERYLNRIPSADYEIGKEMAAVLAKAGVPA